MASRAGHSPSSPSPRPAKAWRSRSRASRNTAPNPAANASWSSRSNAAERLGITGTLEHDDIDIVTAGTGAEALAAIREQTIDCVVLDLRLPDISGFELLEQMRQDKAMSDLPVVVFTGRELSPEEDAQLHALARSVVVKGVESPERLLDETALFLHRVVSDLPAEKQRMLEQARTARTTTSSTSRCCLVDDDVPEHLRAQRLRFSGAACTAW